MPKLPENIRKIGEAFNLKSDDLWNCHGTWVAYHRALERIAAEQRIAFDAPVVLESEHPRVAICVTGRYGEKAEWSIGEAAPDNNKNAYPWAMAEKRAKDRVILKLLGLHGLVYSEEEADDFKPGAANDAPKNPSRATPQTPEEDRLDWHDLIPERHGTWRLNAAKSRDLWKTLKGCIDFCTTPEDLTEFATDNADEIFRLADEARHHLRDAWSVKMEQLIMDRSAA
jgi:hypothetical protein